METLLTVKLINERVKIPNIPIFTDRVDNQNDILNISALWTLFGQHIKYYDKIFKLALKI